MEKTELTGIERQLVLQYLIDGNVPVTVTPLEKEIPQDKEKIRALSSMVFPVALKAEQITVLDKGIILLKNPPQSVQSFAGKKVKVEFYFNRMGLFFLTEMKSIKAGLALVIPETIQRIQDVPVNQTYNFTAVLYYSCRNKSDVNFECIPAENYELFSRPVWSSIALENQRTAKSYLEQFVAEAKKEKNAGNGIQLIPICRYLVDDDDGGKFESLEGRVKPFDILFVDHERIALGYSNEKMPLVAGAEYALKMSFRLKSGPVVSRDVYTTCVVTKIYTVPEIKRVCADCVYTAIQEEDARFLYEKATKTLFI